MNTSGNISRVILRRNGILFSIAIAFYFYLNHLNIVWYFMPSFFAVLFFIFPMSFLPVEKASSVMMKIISICISAVIFFIIVTPVGLIRRIFNSKNSAFSNSIQSTSFVTREHKFNMNDLKYPY